METQTRNAIELRSKKVGWDLLYEAGGVIEIGEISGKINVPGWVLALTYLTQASNGKTTITPEMNAKHTPE